VIMSFKQTVEIYELLDSAFVDGERVVEMFREHGIETARHQRLFGEKGWTDLVEVLIQGNKGKSLGGSAPTLNIAGSLGGIGGRPDLIGLVSDADGALVALASALKIADMRKNGDILDGDVLIRTTICTKAPTMRHDPVTFMSSWVNFRELKKQIIDKNADGILITETTKGNKVINHNGFAISPTVKKGWILEVSPDAISVMERVTGRPVVVVPLSMKDLTPSDSGIDHLNGVGEVPEGVTAPAIGVSITTELPIAGSAQGASSIVSLEAAVRFCVEVAKDFGRGRFKFYNEEQFNKLVSMYGDMSIIQTNGKA
jgi:hypothetical protein